MIIEVLGIFYRNKGAMLMLEAIKAQLAVSLPKARIAVPATMPGEVRERHGLLATPARDAKRVDLSWLKTRLPGGMSDDMIRPRNVDVILDASGFGYGDYWGLPKMRRRLNRALRHYPRPGHAAILLPQALGPFTRPGLASHFRAAAAKLDLIFARDAASYAHAESVIGADAKLRRAPDFTNLLQPDLPPRLSRWRGFSFVIPNQKMVANTTERDRDQYVAFLGRAVDIIAASGRSVAILIHEGRGDRDLADAVNDARETPVAIVDEASALDTKALIGAADLVVSSRFHGLVSALSAAVPALGSGWSHKYAELLRDYGCERHLLRIEEDRWDAQITAFLSDAGDPAFRTVLKAAAAREKARSEEMWRAVIETIRAKT